jgi:hypothetical protein
MRRVEHAACTGKKKSANRVLVGSLKEIELLQYMNVDGRMILKLIQKKADGIIDQDLSDSEQGQAAS